MYYNTSGSHMSYYFFLPHHLPPASLSTPLFPQAPSAPPSPHQLLLPQRYYSAARAPPQPAARAPPQPDARAPPQPGGQAPPPEPPQELSQIRQPRRPPHTRCADLAASSPTAHVSRGSGNLPHAGDPSTSSSPSAHLTALVVPASRLGLPAPVLVADRRECAPSSSPDLLPPRRPHHTSSSTARGPHETSSSALGADTPPSPQQCAQGRSMHRGDGGARRGREGMCEGGRC
jgi:hypothetical protein